MKDFTPQEGFPSMTCCVTAVRGRWMRLPRRTARTLPGYSHQTRDGLIHGKYFNQFSHQLDKCTYSVTHIFCDTIESIQHIERKKPVIKL